MKKLPLGIQTFKEIIQGGYIYADKTQYVYNLINGMKCYFLSRPRRFGKSLLLDTINEVFNGDRELFKGLWLYDSDYDFEEHPVLRLDMSGIANETPEVLKTSISLALRTLSEKEGLPPIGDTPADIIKYLIQNLHDKYNKRVVVLIDEYDKPILDNIADLEIANANRQVVKRLYGILKPMDRYLRLTFITGVSKFTKTSLFSELNNLLDITMTEKYANICGIAIEDLNRYFNEHIASLASHDEFSKYSSLHDEILAWYDGYSWDGKTRVINPFSLLSFLAQERFSSYWYASGTPRFLLDMIKKRPEGYTDLMELDVSEWSLDSFDIQNISAGPLLFQTGYLTVKEVLKNHTPATYRLSMPNREVRIAFNLHILSEFTEKENPFAENIYRRIKDSLESGDLRSMLGSLKSLFASIPFQLHIGREAYYHSIFLALMNVLGFEVNAELSVSGGRIDATLELDDKVYVIEFKYNDCAPDATIDDKRVLFDILLDRAMAQIKDKGYAKRFAGSDKTVYQAAFAFLGRDDIDMRMETVYP